MKFGKLVPRKATRKKAVSLTLTLCMMAGPGLYIPGCGSNDFLGLEDYQRDLLFGVGAVAMALLIGDERYERAGSDDSSSSTVVPGADGLNCWDLNGNGEPDPEEDVSNDGTFDAYDCQGIGSGSATVLSCWDSNGNGVADPQEDVNDDGFFDAFDCRGADGTSGGTGSPPPNGE